MHGAVDKMLAILLGTMRSSTQLLPGCLRGHARRKPIHLLASLSDCMSERTIGVISLADYARGPGLIVMSKGWEHQRAIRSQSFDGGDTGPRAPGLSLIILHHPAKVTGVAI